MNSLTDSAAAPENDIPNRLDIIEAAIAPFQPFPQGAENDPYRLRVLLTAILPALNRVDPGMWGSLTKTDQDNKVPCDIVVWRTTRNHFDCLTSKAAIWLDNGVVVNPAWVFTPLEGSDPVPEPVPGPTPSPSALEAIGRALAALAQGQADIRADIASTHNRLDEVVNNAKVSAGPAIAKILASDKL